MSQEYNIYMNGKTYTIPIEDAREILAIQAGFDSYEDMRNEGYKFNNELDL